MVEKLCPKAVSASKNMWNEILFYRHLLSAPTTPATVVDASEGQLREKLKRGLRFKWIRRFTVLLLLWQ